MKYLNEHFTTDLLQPTYGKASSSEQCMATVMSSDARTTADPITRVKAPPRERHDKKREG
jgi:hypothetical protein